MPNVGRRDRTRTDRRRTRRACRPWNDQDLWRSCLRVILPRIIVVRIFYSDTARAFCFYPRGFSSLLRVAATDTRWASECDFATCKVIKKFVIIKVDKVSTRFFLVYDTPMLLLQCHCTRNRVPRTPRICCIPFFCFDSPRLLSRNL